MCFKNSKKKNKKKSGHLDDIVSISSIGLSGRIMPRDELYSSPESEYRKIAIQNLRRKRKELNLPSFSKTEIRDEK